MTADPLAALREPFHKNQIGHLPRVTCKDCRDARGKVCDRHEKKKCPACDNWITSAHIDLDYVGHATATARLLDVDPTWSWEPMATDEHGLPVLDRNGGLWIRLTVCGVTRPGYGDADGKGGGSAVKEAIGDAIRNAAMRFGVALDLWAKEDLNAPAPAEPGEQIVPTADAKNELLAAVGDRDEAQRLWAGRSQITRGDLDGLLATIPAPDGVGSTTGSPAGVSEAEQQGEEGSADGADPSDPGRPFTENDS